MLEPGDIILYRSFIKTLPEVAVITGRNEKTGNATGRDVPGFGSVAFKSNATFTTEILDESLTLKLDCTRCSLRNDCLDYNLNGRKRLCKHFFRHIEEQGLKELMEAEIPE